MSFDFQFKFTLVILHSNNIIFVNIKFAVKMFRNNYIIFIYSSLFRNLTEKHVMNSKEKQIYQLSFFSLFAVNVQRCLYWVHAIYTSTTQIKLNKVKQHTKQTPKAETQTVSPHSQAEHNTTPIYIYSIMQMLVL